uniref:Uncharacterized protein n=1 Tax=viral metagenome TaxID=1070528 RepID=A0A6M3ME61_9ZZZZ
MVLIEGKNWCTKHNHEIDYELVHEIAADCPESRHGCAECPYTTYKIFRDGVEVQGKSTQDLIAIVVNEFYEQQDPAKAKYTGD